MLHGELLRATAVDDEERPAPGSGLFDPRAYAVNIPPERSKKEVKNEVQSSRGNTQRLVWPKLFSTGEIRSARKSRIRCPRWGGYLCLPNGPRDCLISTLIVKVGTDHSTAVRIINLYAKGFVFQAGQIVAELARVSPVQGKWQVEPHAILDSLSSSGASGAAGAATSGRIAEMTSDWEAVLDIVPTVKACNDGVVAEGMDTE